MARNPFAGDVARLKGSQSYRRRVGDWRLFFDVYPERRLVEVTELARRTTTTYRRR